MLETTEHVTDHVTATTIASMAERRRHDVILPPTAAMTSRCRPEIQTDRRSCFDNQQFDPTIFYNDDQFYRSTQILYTVSVCSKIFIILTGMNTDLEVLDAEPSDSSDTPVRHTHSTISRLDGLHFPYCDERMQQPRSSAMLPCRRAGGQATTASSDSAASQLRRCIDPPHGAFLTVFPCSVRVVFID